MGSGGSSSSSGRGGGGGRGNFKAANAKMPELTGSEKQVSWAEDIRRTALNSIDNFMTSAKDRTLSYGTGDHISVDTVKQVKSDLVSSLQRVTSAKLLIDNRLVFSETRIRDQIFALENERRRKNR